MVDRNFYLDKIKGLKSKITWTDYTINFWMGCEKVSTGCKFCYMHRKFFKSDKNPDTVSRTSSKYWERIKLLKYEAESQLIFTCSMSDFFIKDADEWRKDAWKIIKELDKHQWLILTKRPERIQECLPEDWGENGYSNVWLGVSVGHESELWRVDKLNSLKNQQSKFLTFISAEPLIQNLDFVENCNSFAHTDWIIIGGESGNETGQYRYRRCSLKWIESVINQSKLNNVPVFVKQYGTFLARRLGFKLDRYSGENWKEWSPKYKIREYPSRFKGKTFED